MIRRLEVWATCRLELPNQNANKPDEKQGAIANSLFFGAELVCVWVSRAVNLSGGRLLSQFVHLEK